MQCKRAQFVEAGAAVNSRDRNGETPLMLWVKAQDTPMVAWLIQKGANVNQEALSQTTPLMAAAYAGNADIMRLLLDAGADLERVDQVSKTAMIYAAAQGHAEAVRLLLDRGVDVNRTYAHGLTALMWAAGYGKTECVQAPARARRRSRAARRSRQDCSRHCARAGSCGSCCVAEDAALRGRRWILPGQATESKALPRSRDQSERDARQQNTAAPRGRAHRNQQLHQRPKAIASGHLFRTEVRQQEQSPVAWLAHDVHSRLGQNLLLCLAHFSQCGPTRQVPLLQIDLAVAVQVETLEQAGLVGLPLRKQRVEVAGRVQIGGASAFGSQLAQGVHLVHRSKQPFLVAQARRRASYAGPT